MVTGILLALCIASIPAIIIGAHDGKPMVVVVAFTVWISALLAIVEMRPHP